MRSRSNGRGYPPSITSMSGLDDVSLMSNSTAGGFSRMDSYSSTQKSSKPEPRNASKSPGVTARMNSRLQSLAIPKPGRVKVGIRCRPAFQEEIEFAQGDFFSIIECLPSPMTSPDDESPQYDRVLLTLLSGKQREFAFDFAFDAYSTQDEVYDRIARPVVHDVLRGFNGTIFCYGQTGK
jgi:hypothetical protein